MTSSHKLLNLRVTPVHSDLLTQIVRPKSDPCVIVKEIFKDLRKFDLWPSSWPWKKGRREKIRPPLDSLTMISYISVIHPKTLTTAWPQKNWKVVSKIFLSAYFLKIILQRAAHFNYGHFDVLTMYLGQTVIAHRQFYSFTVLCYHCTWRPCRSR